MLALLRAVALSVLVAVLHAGQVLAQNGFPVKITD